jgi:hypothetical protein
MYLPAGITLTLHVLLASVSAGKSRGRAIAARFQILFFASDSRCIAPSSCSPESLIPVFAEKACIA